MPDILQDLPIAASPARVYEAVSDPRKLDEWWTLASTGQAALGSTYDLDFGVGYQWRAVVTKAHENTSFELRMTSADADWVDTLVGFELEPSGDATQLRFYHRGWPTANDHYRISCHCWALYLRILRRHIEHGESVPYDRRLDV